MAEFERSETKNVPSPGNYRLRKTSFTRGKTQVVVL